MKRLSRYTAHYGLIATHQQLRVASVPRVEDRDIPVLLPEGEEPMPHHLVEGDRVCMVGAHPDLAISQLGTVMQTDPCQVGTPFNSMGRHRHDRGWFKPVGDPGHRPSGGSAPLGLAHSRGLRAILPHQATWCEYVHQIVWRCYHERAKRQQSAGPAAPEPG